LALALYVLGLLAINGYLFSLGASDFSLVRPRFIYTGSLIAICAMICVLVPLYLLRVAGGLRKGESSQDYPVRAQVFLGIIALITPVLLLIVLLAVVGVEPNREPIESILTVYAAAVICSVVCVAIIRAFLKERDTWSALRAGRFAVVVTLAMTAVAIFVATFMANLFPMIPDQFGGGRPTKVALLIKHDEVNGVKALGVPLEANQLSGSAQINSYITAPLELMYEGSEAYLIRLSPDALVRLNKDLVLGVKILR
jgi:amino acid transporter